MLLKRGKITSKERKEVQKTHNTIFDWVLKEKGVVAEKDTFERKEEMEIVVESMEVNVMDKH